MQVKVAKTAGFCWGVRRTVDQLMEVAHERHTPVVTLGPIIHNPQFVARTREMGVGTVERVAEVETGTTVVVRTTAR
jgi:4-hydroxy-3-methylbut-2-enyl diphosphate reductase